MWAGSESESLSIGGQAVSPRFNPYFDEMILPSVRQRTPGMASIQAISFKCNMHIIGDGINFTFQEGYNFYGNNLALFNIE